MANKFEKAFVIGYRDGYHGEAYDKEKYSEYGKPQMWVKYKHGWEAGFLSRLDELKQMANEIKRVEKCLC